MTPTKSVDKLPLQLNLPELTPKSNQDITFYVKSTTIGERNLNVRFSFIMKREKSIASVKNEILKLSVINPFEITTNFLSIIFNGITKFYVGEKFLVVPTINCLSPQPVVIVNTLLEFVGCNLFYYSIFLFVISTGKVCWTCRKM